MYCVFEKCLMYRLKWTGVKVAQERLWYAYELFDECPKSIPLLKVACSRPLSMVVKRRLFVSQSGEPKRNFALDKIKEKP